MARRKDSTLERKVTEEELREELLKTESGRLALAAREDYFRRGGKPLDVEGIRRLVAENRGGLRDDEE
jgi:hypothetical protein